MRREGNKLVGTGEFAAFAQIVERAQGEHEAMLTAAITQAVRKGDARSAFEMLKRRYPESWNTPDKVELSGPDAEPIVVDDARERLMQRVDAARLRLRDMGVIAKS